MALPDDLKQKIRKTYATALSSYTDIDIEVYLRENGDQFITFRYLYEKAATYYPGGGTIAGGTNFGMYWTVTEVLHNTLLEIEPHLFQQINMVRYERYSLPWDPANS